MENTNLTKAIFNISSFLLLLLISFSPYASIDISLSNSSLSKEICTDTTVESYISDIISSGTFTVAETTTGTAHMRLYYPSNVNHSLLKGQLYLYLSNGNKLEQNSPKTLNSSARYLSHTKTNISDNTYYVKAAIVLESDTSKGCVLNSSNFTITTVPTILSTSVSPESAEAGSTFTFYSNLSRSLPSGYSMKVDFGAGNKTMSNYSGNSFRYSATANTVGNNRNFTVSLLDASGAVVASRNNSYTVTEPPETQYAPNLSISSASSSVSQDSSYCISLAATDLNDNLKQVEVNWGDGSSLSVYSYSSNTGSYTKSLCHTYNNSGSYTWTARVLDHTSKEDNVQKSITVNSIIPSISNVYANPTSAESGSNFTFYADLTKTLPSGYQVTVNFGHNDEVMSLSSDNTYSYTGIANTVGVDRNFTVRLLNASSEVESSQSGTYTVTEPAGEQFSPVLTIVSADNEAVLNEQYCVSLNATDQNDNLRQVFINWGDDPNNVPDTHSYASNIGDSTDQLCNNYTRAGSYEWSATVWDHTDRSDNVTKVISVPEDPMPVITVVNQPAASGSTLTATVNTNDNNNVTRTSFTIFELNGANSIDISSSVSVISPSGATYNNSANSWGYDPVNADTTTNWQIDISNLPDGNYEIEFYAADGVNASVSNSGKYSFTRSSAALPSFVSNVVIEDSGINIGVDYKFSVELSEPLPNGYGVFINFDDQQGEWFVQNTPGGHMELEAQTDNIYSVEYSLVKPGLRSVRAGIFDLQGDSDPSNDILLVGYTDFTTCTLASCFTELTKVNSYGDPAIIGNGSQLFKQVDVASGNYHLSSTDIAVSGKGPSFNFIRSYNSLSEPGKQWSFNYQVKAEFVTGTFNRELVISPKEDGHSQHYFKDMDQKWYAFNAGNFDRLIENSDGSFTLYTQGNRLYNFTDPTSTEAGRLLSIGDRLGNTLTLNYSDNNLTGLTDANNRSYTITRDSNNRIQRVTDFTGRYIEYTYDANSMITAVRNMRGNSYSYTYVGTTGDARYQLASIKDPRTKLQLSMSYDSNKRVASITNGLNQQTNFTYGKEDGQQATGIEQPSVDGLNHNVGFILDNDRTRVLERLDAQNFGDYKTKQTYKSVTSRYKLAEQALVTSSVDPKNNTTVISYTSDGAGNPNQITDALNRQTNATYSTVANQINLTPIDSVQQAGVATSMRYRSFIETGQPSTIIDPRNFTTTNSFDSNGWLTQTTDAEGNITRFTYDEFGNNTQIVDALSNQINKTYDGLGRVLTESSPLGLLTSYTYDENSNVLSRTEKGGSLSGDNYTYVTQYGYDASDNLTYHIDPRGNRTDYVYDDLNRKVKENYTVADTRYSRSFAYDAMSRLMTVTNERNQISKTHYTNRSQVKYKVNPLNKTVVTYSYDDNGNVTTVTDAENRTVTTSYDALNRKIRVEDDNGNYQTWGYNPAGQVASYRDSRGEITSYEYDATGNLTKLTDPSGGITRSTYDGNGNLLTVTDPNNHTTAYTYDALNRVLTRKDHSGHTWSFTYDENGNVFDEIMPTGERINRQYDESNRVRMLTEFNASNGVVRQVTYTYDENSNILSKTSSGNTISYGYDELNRVNSVTNQFGQTIGYTYDSVGNLTQLIYPNNKTVNYSYDDADQLVSITDWLNKTTTYIRNDAGQPTQVILGNGTKATYQYDIAGRLINLQNKKSDNSIISSHAMTLDGGGNITKATVSLPLAPTLPTSKNNMTYDDNNRILSGAGNTYTHDDSGRITEQDKSGVKKVYNFDVNDKLLSITQGGKTLSSYQYDQNNNRISQTQNGIETRYILDENRELANVLAETNAAGIISQYYIYGDGLVSSIDAANNSHYYHFDPTGHTLALTDENGRVSDKYAYTPYGLTTSQGSTHNPFKYVGRYGVMDDSNGLHYMRARYYKEDIKRFISLDAMVGSMQTPQTLNRYAYVLGNPVMGIDPSGKYFEYGSKGYKVLSKVELFGKHWIKNTKDFGVHLKNETVDTANAIGRVAKDIGVVYIYEPANNTVIACKKKLDGMAFKTINCLGAGMTNVAGAGLDVLNPATAVKAALREPIRNIAGDDVLFEKELISVADGVLMLMSIKDAPKNLKNARRGIDSANKAIKTISAKIDKRGLVMSKHNKHYHISKYLETLTSVVQTFEKAIEINNFNK
ncbi:RHS repeat-associated core domain-containing protein [Psychrobium sp. nBUS_13]|uniref:RHS repeat-associated core domain-containing protein n=1 Tax=Psychrobium sp. nBUS_13 TaxID=3395319 RepID=UPI003EBDACAD